MNTKLIIAFIFWFTLSELSAQPEDPGGDVDVPITGIEILIGAGSLLGARYFFSKNKKNND